MKPNPRFAKSQWGLIGLLFVIGLSIVLWVRHQAETAGELPSRSAPSPPQDVAADPISEEPIQSPQMADRVRNAIPTQAVGKQKEGLIEEADRGLSVRVLNAKGEWNNGVPVFICQAPCDDVKELPYENKRITGKHRNRSPESLRGMAAWSNTSPALYPAWKAFDEGQTDVSVTVGVELPGTEHLWLTLPLLSWPGGPVELQLDDAASTLVAPIRVLVSLANGEPAPGIPVGISVTTSNPDVARSMGLGSGDLDSGGLPRTGPDGIALLNRQEVLRWIDFPIDSETLRDGNMAGQDLRFEPYLFLAVPMGNDIRVALPKGTDLDQLFALTLPQGARLVGVAVDHLDRPIQLEPGQRSLRYRLDWEQGMALFGNPKEGDFSGVTDQNPFDLGWCALGVKLEASISFTDNSYPRTVTECRGPQKTGEPTEVRFVVGEPFPLVQFQVLGFDGSPLANSEVQADRYFTFVKRRSNERKKRHWQTYPTDAQGNFALTWNAAGPVKPMVLTLQAQVDGESAWASKELPTEFRTVLQPPGPNPGDRALLDGGTLTLSRQTLPPLPKWVKPLVASGRLFDEAGNPAKKTRVEACPLDHHYRFAYAWTDDDGFFEILKDNRGPFRLTFNSQHYEFQSTEEIPYGASGLTFTLQSKPDLGPPGKLHGKLLNIPKTAGDNIELRIDTHNMDFQVIPKRDGSFQFQRIPPGKVDVYIHCKALSLEIARFKDVVIRSDEDLTDPRLENLDIGPLVRLTNFRFKMPPGVTPPSGKIPLHFDKSGRTQLRLGRKIKRQILVPAENTIVRFGGHGFLKGEASLLSEEALLEFHLKQ